MAALVQVGFDLTQVVGMVGGPPVGPVVQRLVALPLGHWGHVGAWFAARLFIVVVHDLGEAEPDRLTRSRGQLRALSRRPELFGFGSFDAANGFEPPTDLTTGLGYAIVSGKVAYAVVALVHGASRSDDVSLAFHA